MKYKIPAALAITALAVTLSACSATPSEPSATADCTPDSSLTTAASGKLTVGVPTFMPFTEVADGKPSGVDGDLILAIADELCLEVVTVPLDYAGLIPAVQQNRIDVAIGSIYRTEARAEQAGVTSPTYLDQMGVISEAGVSTVDEMKSLVVGTIDGNLWVDDLQAVLGGEVKLYPSSNELKQDLEAGRVDVAIDSFGASTLTFEDSAYKVELMTATDDIAASTEPGQTGFYYPKENTKLGELLDEQIDTMREDGTIGEILTKWGLDASAADTGAARLL